MAQQHNTQLTRPYANQPRYTNWHNYGAAAAQLGAMYGYAYPPYSGTYNNTIAQRRAIVAAHNGNHTHSAYWQYRKQFATALYAWQQAKQQTS